MQDSDSSVWAGEFHRAGAWHEEEKYSFAVGNREIQCFPPTQAKVNGRPLISYGLCQEGYLSLI